MSAVISARGLSYAYASAPNRKVLREVDLDVAQGEIVIVTGASGVGKTTLLTLCGALRTGQDGELHVLGRNLRNLDRDSQRGLRGSIGFVFQTHYLIDALTAGQNVVMSLLASPSIADSTSRAERALHALGLTHRIDALPKELSGGEQQRVAIARALVRQPRLLLADEPTASLDDASAAIVKRAIALTAKQHACGALMVTHDARLFDLADRNLRLVDGRLVEERARSGISRINNWLGV